MSCLACEHEKIIDQIDFEDADDNDQWTFKLDQIGHLENECGCYHTCLGDIYGEI